MRWVGGVWRKSEARLLVGTIWERALLEEVPRRFRPIYTIVLPLKYFIFTLFGLLASANRIPTIDHLTSVDYGDLWTAMVGLTASLCLAGLIWRREQLELYSLILLCAGLATYPIGAAVLAIAGDSDRAPLAVGLFVFLVLPIWRIFDLVRTLRLRKESDV